MEASARLRFEAYVSGRWAVLHRVALLVTQDPSTAEDVVQSAFVRLCSSWSKVERAADVDAYVNRVIVNAAIDRARKIKPETLTTAPPDHATSDADPGQRLDLAPFLRRLPAQQRAVVVLRFYADCSVEETAAALGIRTGTVKSHTSRALTTLRHDLTMEDHHAH